MYIYLPGSVVMMSRVLDAQTDKQYVSGYISVIRPGDQWNKYSGPLMVAATLQIILSGICLLGTLAVPTIVAS